MTKKFDIPLTLILVSGLPGVGKSAIAERLSKELGIPIFSVDPIESAIIRSGVKRSFETGLAAYLVAENLAVEQFKRGISVVIDAVNSVKEAREMWHHLSDKFHATLIIIECVLDSGIHKKRIEARVRNMHGIPEVAWKDIEKSRNEYLKWEEERLVLDTARNMEDNLGKALNYIHTNRQN